MRIITSKTPPSTTELAEILNREFSKHYSYKLFGLWEKSIIVGKSTLVGAQISIGDNEFTIQATAPSIAGNILSVLGFAELGLLLLPLFFGEGLPLSSQWRELEREIGLFLKHKYN